MEKKKKPNLPPVNPEWGDVQETEHRSYAARSLAKGVPDSHRSALNKKADILRDAAQSDAVKGAKAVLAQVKPKKKKEN